MNISSKLIDGDDASYITLLNDETKFDLDVTNHLAFHVRDKCVSQQRLITIQIGLKQEVDCNDYGTEGHLRVRKLDWISIETLYWLQSQSSISLLGREFPQWTLWTPNGCTTKSHISFHALINISQSFEPWRF